MVGLGVGSTTEFAGGKDRMIGVSARRALQRRPGGRLLEWYGPYAQFNFGGLTGFQWGPAVSLRLGRSGVDDPVVSRIHEIDTTVEAGGWFGYEYLHEGSIPLRLRGGINVMTNAGIVYGGARVTATRLGVGARAPPRLCRRGVGASWVSDSFNRTYFGVTDGDSAASGLPAYNPGGGLEQFTGWFALIYQIDKHWYAGAMVYAQRLTEMPPTAPSSPSAAREPDHLRPRARAMRGNPPAWTCVLRGCNRYCPRHPGHRAAHHSPRWRHGAEKAECAMHHR
ncbi:MipA/OmpV family protein [Cupriavidus basilensis]